VGRLEDNLPAELAVEGFAGANAGSMSGLTATPLEANQGLGLVLPAHGRFCGCTGLADYEALVFEGEKAEEFVSHKRAAARKAGVVVPDLLLGVREGALCPEEFVAVEVVYGSVQEVGAGAESQVDGATGLRPPSGPDWVCAENRSTASRGRMMPAIPETPP
jgi:hypothetical protein